jgi:hypothetical protein
MLALKIQLNTKQSEPVLSIKSFSGNMDKFKRMRSYEQDIETGSAPLFTLSTDTSSSLFSKSFLDCQMEFQINQICFVSMERHEIQNKLRLKKVCIGHYLIYKIVYLN